MHILQRILFSLLGYSLIFWFLDLKYDTLTQNLIDGTFHITGGVTAYLSLAILLGIINSLLKPILMLLATPLRWLTLGLFTVVINAFLLWLLQLLTTLIPFDVGIHIEHWQTYAVVGIILSFINGIIHWFEK